MFAKTAISLNNYNSIRHENIAFYLLKNVGLSITDVDHYHHYGMEKNNAIKIGCYLVEKNQVFPVFSKPSFYIDLFAVDSGKRIADDGRFIVPHGWGKHLKEHISLKCNLDEGIFYLNDEAFHLFSEDSLYRLTNLQYRDYEGHDGMNCFYSYHKDEMSGTLVKRLFQKICLSASGINCY